jgi:glucose-6-phosphate isomerase
MSITASRLGSSPITIDWSNLKVSPGSVLEDVEPAWAALKQRFSSGEVGFYDAPINNDISCATASLELADKILKQGTFTDVLFLGIGGSSLGPISLLSATQELQKSGLHLHFLENPDPYDWKLTLSRLKPQTTLVVPITKSGTTFETMAQLLLACDWLGKDRWKTHLVAITDPVRGDLRTFVNAQGIPSLPVPPSIGGRFSIFCPVGIFPAALAGLDVQSFLLGAKQIRDFMEKAPLEKNPIFILGCELLRRASKHHTHVCMPYSTRLRLIGDWFVQLWGESLGKDGKGFTPIAAVGATDQHSILQLLRDGPDDKVTFFLTIDQVLDEVQIPRVMSAGNLVGQTQLAAFKLLEGHTLQELLMVEYRATSLVLTKQGRPNVNIQIDRLDERSLGALYFAFSVLTAFTGTLWGVNPFDQPGVEEGKVYIRESLSQEKPSRPEDDDNSPVARLRRGR